MFPSILLQRGVQGDVWLSYVITENGTVDMDQVHVWLSDHRLFTGEVEKTIASWRFEPALRGGRPVAVRMFQRFPFRFRVTN